MSKGASCSTVTHFEGGMLKGRIPEGNSRRWRYLSALPSLVIRWVRLFAICRPCHSLWSGVVSLSDGEGVEADNTRGADANIDGPLRLLLLLLLLSKSRWHHRRQRVKLTVSCTETSSPTHCKHIKPPPPTTCARRNGHGRLCPETDLALNEPLKLLNT